jgi:predicted metal-dependent TIM-barrel fold hydrolase
VLFDAHLNARALGKRDLADLRFFGVAGALVPISDWPGPAGADAVRRDWALLAGPLVYRMRRCGLAGFAALGIHPARIPRRGLEALLTDLPDFLGRPAVVAIGEIGLAVGTPREEEVFSRQLALAKDLRLPVLVRTPWRAKSLVTRRSLAILRRAELEPSKVLVDHADARTAKMIRACGYRAGISLSATPTSGRRSSLDEAVKLIESFGPEGLVLGSDAGEGAGDLLALPRIADRLAAARLSDAVIRRVCGGNAVAFLGVEAQIPT